VAYLNGSCTKVCHQTELLDSKNKIEDASKENADVKVFSGVPRNIPSATSNLQSVVDKISPIIEPLKAFNAMASGIANVSAFYLPTYTTDSIYSSIPMRRWY